MSEMQTKTYRHAERGLWGDGPWATEPDKAQWVDAATGLDCLAVRGPLGALCGYVGVAEGHPAFQRHYEDVDASAHGGLTYSAFCQDDAREEGICHLPEPGRPHRVWWLGFDCAHLGDLVPGLTVLRASPVDTYRDLAFVREECASLAHQLHAMV